MARHNRDGRGTDQRGIEYEISYQPDWLRRVKVTRDLPGGRQSTKTLFRNPEPPIKRPGRTVRTRIRSAAQPLDFEIAVTDPGNVVRRVIVETAVPGQPGDEGRVAFLLDQVGRVVSE